MKRSHKVISLDNLPDIPDGTSLLFDTNIFIYWALDHPRFGDSCENCIHRVEDGEIKGIIPSVVANELLHRMMIAELIGNGWAHTGQEAVNLLKHDATIIRKLSKAWDMHRELTRMHFVVLDPYQGITDDTYTLSKKYALLASDAAILSYAQKYSIRNLATNDADFSRVDGLACWKP